jgi:hypothetical protein
LIFPFSIHPRKSQSVTHKPEKISHKDLFSLTSPEAEGGIAQGKAYKQHFSFF